MQGRVQRKQDADGTTAGTQTGAVSSGSPVQLRGLSYDEQVQALTPEAQAGDGAPIQMRGDRGGSMIPEYDYKSMKVHSITYDTSNVWVDVTVTVKNGKDVIKVDIDDMTERFKSVKQTMRGFVAGFEEKLSARGQKALLNALVRAYKKHGKAEKEDEDE